MRFKMARKTLSVDPYLPKGPFQVEVYILKEKGDKVLIKSAFGVVKELSKLKGKDYFEITDELVRNPDNW